MEHIANLMRIAFRHFKGNCNDLLLIVTSSILFILGLLIILNGSKGHSKEGAELNNTITTPTMTIAILTPTKWWIKRTATPLDTALGRLTPTSSTSLWTTNCSKQPSATLKPNTYAYISLNPPLPNRVRSIAGLSSNYLGQIDPGNGLKLINGPICADGYSWWLVEANESGLRGWTVEGKRSEQWILPCPDRNISCSKTNTPTSTPIPATTQKPHETREPECDSDKFAAGMFIEVEQDSLLILRSQPYTGEVIGRAAPLSVAKVIGGPACTGNTIWWKLNVFDLDLTGWATETGLEACPKDSECNLEPH